MNPKRFFFHAPSLFSAPLRCSAPVFIGFITVFISSYDGNAGTPLHAGSGRSNATSSQGATAGSVTPAATDIARANAQDALVRTNQTISAVRVLQNAARSAALASGANHLGANPSAPTKSLPVVPNGLDVGGLQASSDPAKKWTGANDPIQTTENGSTAVTIKQTAQQALLNWQTFNVGKATTLTFDQTAGGENVSQWIAFNKVSDPTGNPSQILGSIKTAVETTIKGVKTFDNSKPAGQLYIINGNGVIFGGSSQVNARGLTVSSLPINTNLIQRGLLNNPDAQFLFSGLKVSGGSDGTPDFVPEPPVNNHYGDITVQAGALLTTLPPPVPTEPAAGSGGNGGRIMLVGPNVTNDGTINTASGQTVLAAGLQVGVAAHNGSDPSLRGLDVWVGAVGDYAGTATNSGIIESIFINKFITERLSGNTWISGRYVNQLGVIDSSTSVNLNGRIDLKASYGAVSNPNFDSSTELGSGGPMFFNQFTGVVTLGQGSATRILPDYASTKAVPGTALPERSQVNIEGLSIHFDKNSTLLAPNAEVSVRAGVWPYKDLDGSRTIFDANGQVEAGITNYYSGASQRFFFNDGQIYLDDAAVINVAGSVDVFVPLSQSILNVQLRGPELADSPLQRNSVLRGQTLTVDIRNTGIYNGKYWIGTPLGDVTGLAGLIERNAAQLTAVGGNINLQAGGSIVVSKNSAIDVSGGYYNYEGGLVKTSSLRSNGKIVDIKNATPDQVYDGVFTGVLTVTSEKWGVTSTFVNPLYAATLQKSYVGGAAGGTLTMTAPSMAIDGVLRGLTVEGPRQRDKLPSLSTLHLNFESEKTLLLNGNLNFIATSLIPPAITFAANPVATSIPTFTLVGDAPVSLSVDRLASVSLAPDLLGKEGFGNLDILNPDGTITVPADIILSTTPKGSIALAGANISILGNMNAAGGSLSFTTFNISPTDAAEYNILNPIGSAPFLAPNVGRGSLTLANGASLSTAGILVDDSNRQVDLMAPKVIVGGSITIRSYQASLAKGSQLGVSGAAYVSENNKVTYGKGGSISILTGKDIAFSGVIGGGLVLDSTLSGYSGAAGGSLSIQAGQIQIGEPLQANALNLTADFFTQGGFTKYDLTGVGAAGSPSTGPVESYLPAISIAAGCQIEPLAESLIVMADNASNGELGLKKTLHPKGVRSPVSLSFTALGSDDPYIFPGPNGDKLEVRGDIVMGAGAKISTDAGASVSFKGDTVTLLGSVIAPGGAISVSGARSFRLSTTQKLAMTQALPTVHLGAAAQLNVAGVTELVPDVYGRRVGKVYAGGSISVSGNILAESGSALDVSGTSGILDIDPATLANRGVAGISGLNFIPFRLRGVATRIDSNGGLIDLTAYQMLLSDATLHGAAGGATATGGELSVFSGNYYREDQLRTSADVNLVVKQSGNAITNPTATLGVGIGLFDPSGSAYGNTGFFALDRFQQGSFASLSLGGKFLADASPIPYGGNIDFQGKIDVQASGTLRLAGGGVIQANDAVHLSASYIFLGQKFLAPQNPNDTFLAFQQYPANPSNKYNFKPSYGPGNLQLSAGSIDVGTLALENIGHASLTSNGGDIRGNGVLSMVGDLVLTAAQVYPTTLANFDIFAYDHSGIAGSVTIHASGASTAPLSAGGHLAIDASKIYQAGVLRAPLGSIRIGWDGSAASRPFDSFIVGSLIAPPIAQEVDLQDQSVTSVSAKGLEIPFGMSPDGLTWIDPSGVNITLSGLPEKSVLVSANNVNMNAGSTVDVSGGGDLFATRWVTGNGGSMDLLGTASAKWGAGKEYQPGALVTFNGATWSARVRNSGQTPAANLYWSKIPESYVIVPGFNSKISPYGDYNTGANAASLSGNPGDISSSLKVGDSITLEASDGLAAGTYTLLPRGYAALQGAYLVTPVAGNSASSTKSGDGASYVSGYFANSFNQPATISPVRARFEVASADVFKSRVSYAIYSANDLIGKASPTQLLPKDAGYVAFQGGSALQLAGTLLTQSAGRGAVVDISSEAKIYLMGGDRTARKGSQVTLQTDVLNSWGAESLLIGGTRSRGAAGTTIDVHTDSLTLDNPGNLLSAPEIILASNKELELTKGSAISSTGVMTQPADALLIQGDGTLLRVSGDSTASVTRSGLTGSALPLMTIGENASITGSSVILDSTYGSILSPLAKVQADALTLGSGQISVVFDGVTGPGSSPYLTLAGVTLSNAQQSKALTLQSYRSIDFYGVGSIGGDKLEKITLSSNGLRGYQQGSGNVMIQAKDVYLKNSANAAVASAPVIQSGALTMDARTIHLGVNAFAVSGYQDLALNASDHVVFEGSGAFSTLGNLVVNTPLITGTKAATYTIQAGQTISLARRGVNSSIVSELGASLTVQGTSIAADTDILLPSGQLTLNATAGALEIGGHLSVAGTSRAFNDLTRFSDAGSITLESETGNVVLSSGSNVSVAAATVGGNAGTLSVLAPQGIFINVGNIHGEASTSETAGRFLLDVRSLDATRSASFNSISSGLKSGGFFASRNFRIRNGDVTLDNANRSHEFTLSADQGSISVNGSIDASGKTGGSISLAAHNNLTLAAGSNLSVAAQQFDSAGKGGSILLEAGTQLNGTANTSALLDLQQGSQIDLSVATYVAGEYTKFGSSAFEGKFTGTLHLRAPRNADNSDVLINPIHSEITGASAVVVEGYKVYDLTDYGGMMNIAAKSWVQLDGQAFLGAAGSLSANDKVITDRLLANQSAEQKEKLSSVLVLAPGVEMINSATAANTQLYLNSAGSTITIAAGGSVLFPNGSFGNSVISSAAATIVSATGEATSIDAKTPTVIPLGSKLLFGNSGATVTYATVIGSPGGAIEASLVTGSSYTTGSTAATNSSANIAERGTIVSLNSASGTFEKASSIALNTGSAITFPNGTGSSKIRSNVTGKIASRVGVVTDLIANTDITIPSGSYITLNEAGSISYSSGTGGVSIALASGSLKTNLAVTITPPTGDLTLGLANNSATGSTNPEALASADWDFSAFRYGMKSAPGVLTLRTSGNLVFNNTLSDGFTPVTPGASNGDSSMWLAPLMTLPKNAPLGSYPLPTNAQSWSYRLTAGADMNASNFRSVLSASDLGSSKGSVLVGEFYPAVPNTLSDSERAAVGPEGKTANSIRISKTDANKGNRFEVIRTGTGDITLSAGRDVQLRNQFSTIYTAGVALPTPTTIYGANDFVLPVNLGLDIIYTADGTLGAAQQLYAPSWSLAGGNVVISAQANIGRYTRFYDNTGSPTDVIIADSSREMPTNWLYRRGFVDPKTQLFANDGGFADDRGIVTDNATSTAWWIDFSNFFQGVGALGGGNVSLTAGNDVVNADAVSPTNARMPGLRDGVNVAPDASKLLELGGGDVSVVAGRNIDGGVYYVEKGKGTLFAGGEITTNASRSPSLGILNAGDSAPLDPLTWLPTTLFVGKSTFDVAARGDVLLGPITNPFLLPQGINNNFWYKTYFNTYSPDAGATVASYGGDITHRMAVSLPGDSSSTSIMSAWFSSQGLFNGDESTASSNQPWLRLSELKLFASYSSIFGLTAPNLESTSFGGDLNLVGSWTLFPSATGNLQLAANSNIVGLQKSGVGNRGLQVWTASTINLSDASPAALPGVITPLAYQSQSEVGRTLDQAYHSGIDILQVTRDSLSETGSSTGSAATSAVKQALHAPGILHSDDSNPVRLFATGGDITGLTLFSPKATQIMAQRDITDIAFYLQNISASDITLVSAGRDIIPFAENSTIRSLANNVTMGNAVGDLLRSTASGDSTSAMAGDIQINGPGVMEVLSGRNIDLGTGANFTDGTGVGITSIGNLRNPNLPFGGADLIALAGVSGAGGQADGLSLSSMNVDAFISQYLSAGTDRTQSAYLEKIDWNGEFSELTAEQKAIVALEKFYQILRDTGRNVPKAGNYDAGYEAVATLFGKDQPIGDILTRAREIRTTTGGAISLASVGGGITMASAIFGNPLTPPGIVTEYGGAISTFTEKDVSIGQARIFTLRGGDITMWSSNGNIAAGTSPKTVVTAPPTRVLINVNSADVQTDLGGLATGGGIGVLAAVEGVKAGNVDLIAPKGYVDAGDAGIRVTGNLNIAANVVLNSSNISTGGTSTGTNPGAVSAPSVASVSSASSSGAAAGAAMTKPDSGKPAESKPAEEPLSLYTVEVIGYGGGDAEDTESEEKQKSL